MTLVSNIEWCAQVAVVLAIIVSTERMLFSARKAPLPSRR